MYNIKMLNQPDASKQFDILLRIKENRVVLSTLVILILGAFYWYEIRPTMVRNNCVEWAIEYSQENTPDPSSVKLTDADYEIALQDAIEVSVGKFGNPKAKPHKDGFDGLVKEANDRRLKALQSGAEYQREKVVKGEYEKCMFEHGLEDNL